MTDTGRRGFRKSIALSAWLTTSTGVGGGCSGATSGDEALEQGPGSAAAPGPEGPAPEPAELGPVAKGSGREHPAGAAFLVQPGQEPRRVELGWAEAQGYTLVDLSDGWVPYIFSSKTPGRGDASANAYAERYVALAADRTDDDGDPLAAHEHNYLELYGIPPTLSVVRAEWERVDGELQACLDAAGWDPEVFRRFSGTIAFHKGRGDDRIRKARWARAALEKQMKRAKVAPEDWAAAAEHPSTRAPHRAWRALQDEVDVIAHAQKRFRCEKLFASGEGEGRYAEGQFDAATHHALAAFEKKHAIMGWGHFTPENVAMLGRSAAESTHARLLRAVTERVVAAAGVVEDGSAAERWPDLRWTDADGQEQPLRDLVGEVSRAALEQLDLATPESARRALDRLAALDGGFERLVVALELPARPAYYAAHMELDAVIDRGDIWYDYPFDEQGNRRSQPRQRFPRLTIYTTWRGQRIPLVHWRTTVGSWRTELEAGQEWYAYKNSDVGPRVWKDLMAAPTWIPPASTPLPTLVKRKYKDGKLRTVVNYDETGPGYRSAYGLVAAYHIKQVTKADGTVVELDNQIRTHGSVDYMSILRRFSHGCHRLYNMNAVRLFSFVLLHRDYVRHGQTKIGFARAFEHEGQSHRMWLGTRGYQYELTPPIPVEVTEGRIRGARKRPITEFMPKPGVEYGEVEDAAQAEAFPPAPGL